MQKARSEPDMGGHIGGERRTNRELGLTELLAAEAERHGGAPVVAGGGIRSDLKGRGEKNGMGKTTGSWSGEYD